MELFPKECKYCKSKNHTSDECPHNHGIFGDTKCIHCGSTDHSSKNCPHERGIILSDTKCFHCGSIEHSSENCPHDRGILFGETKCIYCESKNHSSKNCPHERGILSGQTKCVHCGSRDHSSKRCPHNRQQTSMNDWLIKIGLGLAAFAAAVWAIITIGLPLLIINISLVAFIIGLFFKKNWQLVLFPISILGIIVSLYDFNFGSLSKHLVDTVPFLEPIIPFFCVVNVGAGLISIFLLFNQNYLNKIKDNKPKYQKHLYIIIGSLLLLATSIFCLQKFVLTDLSITNSQENSPIPSTENLSTTQTQQTNETAQINNSTSNSEAKIEAIKGLLNAEETRDINSIQSYFSNNIQRYWEKYNITPYDLQPMYESTWTKIENCKNNNSTFQSNEDGSIDLFGDFSYYSYKSHETKTLQNHVRYYFDNNNKIIQTFGVK